jgi:hypothetical protein
MSALPYQPAPGRVPLPRPNRVRQNGPNIGLQTPVSSNATVRRRGLRRLPLHDSGDLCEGLYVVLAPHRAGASCCVLEDRLEPRYAVTFAQITQA